MLKRLISCIIVVVMLVSVVSIHVPQNTAYAAGTIWLEVTRDSAPVRAEKHDEGKVLRRLKIGTIITAQKKELNLKLRWWYKLKNGEYIYSGNVKETHEHKLEIVGYESAHPHYALHECRHCKNGAYCGPETKKVKGCEKCYPTSTESKKENTNKIPNTNSNTNADILVPSRPSLQEEAEKNLGGTIHTHNYTLSHYESSHPHYAVYKCTCPDSYKDTSKTQKQSGCEQCNTHYHSYKLTGYSNSHPHYATYQCSCKSAYTGTETTKLKECIQCYPYGYGNDHACQFVCTMQFYNQHPHYTISRCTICGKEQADDTSINYSSECNICNSEFKEKMEDIPDFYGRVYDLKTGKLMTTIDKVSMEELFEFAEAIHSTLDILGLIPVAGEVFDGMNVAYYIVEGDYVNAALSGAAMVPIVGVVTTSGKIVSKSAKIAINTVTGVVEEASQKAVKEFVEASLDNVSDVGIYILKRYNKYGDYPQDTIRAIKKISENRTLNISEVFYNGKLLVGTNCTSTIISKAGLKYKITDGENTVKHIIRRHAANSSENASRFNKNGEELFDLIDDVVTKGKKISGPTKPNDIGRVVEEYEWKEVVGGSKKTGVRIVKEGEYIVTAIPISID